jgi:kynurenine formamidase
MSNWKEPISYEELSRREDAPAWSTWGMFGPDDELGMVNILSSDQVLAGVKCVRRGAVFNLDLPLGAFDPPISSSRRPPKHTVVKMGPHMLDDFLDGFYLQGTSQIDGLRHVMHPDFGFYNGHKPDKILPDSPTLGINRWAEHALIGRGVLLDVGSYLESTGDPIDYRSGAALDVDTLEATATAQKVDIRPGDMVLLRTGWLQFVLAELSDDDRMAMRAGGMRCPGIAQSVGILKWLWKHQVPLLAADNIAVECSPRDPDTAFLTAAERASSNRASSAGSFHHIAIPLLGMALGELWNLDSLADDCKADGVWEFMLSAKPLNVVGGVGSPANAVAIK